MRSASSHDKRSDYFCTNTKSGYVGAMVKRASNSLLICPATFRHGQPDITKYAAHQHRIHENDPISEYYAISRTWIHELTHLLSGTSDVQAKDMSGRIPGGTAYGFEYCVALAKFHSTGAMDNADCYAVFAVAMYLDEWDWSSGRARKPGK